MAPEKSEAREIAEAFVGALFTVAGVLWLAVLVLTIWEKFQ